MDAKDFNQLVLTRLNRRELTLCRKVEEFVTDKDRLHNFKVAARVPDISTIAVLRGMKIKAKQVKMVAE